MENQSQHSLSAVGRWSLFCDFRRFRGGGWEWNKRSLFRKLLRTFATAPYKTRFSPYVAEGIATVCYKSRFSPCVARDLSRWDLYCRRIRSVWSSLRHKWCPRRWCRCWRRQTPTNHPTTLYPRHWHLLPRELSTELPETAWCRSRWLL